MTSAPSSASWYYQDNDSAGDACDGCPSDSRKTQPGSCGCGVADSDYDGDGTPDCIDGCPRDRRKLVPGVCGCGKADNDTGDADGDTVPNCVDLCVGADDRPDLDSDGIPDCRDRCPLDAESPRRGERSAFVLEAFESVLEVFNLGSGLRTARVSGVATGRLAADPLGRFVALSDGFGGISLIDVDDPSQQRTLAIEGGTAALGYAARGSRLLLADRSSNTRVKVVNLATMAIEGEISIPTSPTTIHFSSAGDLMFSGDASGLSIFDLESRRVVGSIPGAPSFFLLAQLPNRKAALSTILGNSLAVLDLSTFTTVGSVPLPAPLRSIAVSPDGSTIYAGLEGRLAVVDVRSRTVVEDVSSRLYTTMELDAEGTKIFANALEPPTLDTLDVVTKRVLDQIQLERSGGVVITPDLRGDANCDRIRSAADLVALAGLLHSGTRAACRWDDANRDCRLEPADAAATVRSLFAP